VRRVRMLLILSALLPAAYVASILAADKIGALGSAASVRGVIGCVLWLQSSPEPFRGHVCSLARLRAP
jgi:hypothetical protein